MLNRRMRRAIERATGIRYRTETVDRKPKFGRHPFRAIPHWLCDTHEKVVRVGDVEIRIPAR